MDVASSVWCPAVDAEALKGTFIIFHHSHQESCN